MPTQVSLLDGALASAGTLAIQTNGTTNAITISSAQVATFVNNPIMTGLTASRAVFTDGSKGLTSNAITGTGNVVMSASPTLTGTIDGAALTLSSSLTLSGGTANGVLYLNGSKVATSGSALTFDGTTLANSTSGTPFSLNRTGAATALIELKQSGTVGSYLGTSGSNDFIIFNGSAAELARFNNTGLGIGTSSPTNALTVGTTSAGKNIAIYSSSNGNNGLLRMYDLGGTERLQLSANSTGEAVYYAPTGSVHAWYINSEQMRLTSTGLGIGTSSPGYRLDTLLGAGSGNIFRAGQSGVSNGYTITTSGSALTHIWANGGSDAMRLDTSGNLGLGVTPSAWASRTVMEVGAAGNAFVSGGAGDVYISEGAYYNAGWKYGNSLYAVALYNQYRGTHSWSYAAAGTAGNAITFTQALTLGSDGNLLVGTTSGSWTGNDARIYSLVSSGWAESLYTTGSAGGASIMRVDNTGAKFIDFRYTSTNVGSITTNGTTTAYNTSSDYRLKENIQPMTGALAKIQALKPCTYNWKADGSAGEGFIAHELAEVVPQCVTGAKDAVDADGNPVYQGIDTSFLVATLTAAIQELNAKVQALEAQLNKGA